MALSSTSRIGSFPSERPASLNLKEAATGIIEGLSHRMTHFVASLRAMIVESIERRRQEEVDRRALLEKQRDLLNKLGSRLRTLITLISGDLKNHCNEASRREAYLQVATRFLGESCENKSLEAVLILLRKELVRIESIIELDRNGI